MSQKKLSKYKSPFLLSSAAAIGFFARDLFLGGLFETIAKSLEPLGSSKLAAAAAWLSLALSFALLLLVWAYRQWQKSANETSRLKSELLRLNPNYEKDSEYRQAWNEAP
jgi:hypothetical protein